MDKQLEAIQVQLAGIAEAVKGIEALATAVKKFTTDLTDFSERFEEVVTALEAERRIDLFGLND